VKDIQNYQLNWKGYVDEMGENGFPKKIFKYKLVGMRDVVRPRSEWTDQF
jgi:hypothetical protein